MAHIKKLNEFHTLSEDEISDKKRIVNNRLSNIELKKELKSKLDELYQIIEKL